MAERMNVDYDKENDILWIGSGRKVSDSLEVDKFVIDFLKNGNVAGVEIMDASNIISNLASIRISRNVLGHVEDARLRYYKSSELVYVVLQFKITIGNAVKNISLQVPAPKQAVMALNG